MFRGGLEPWHIIIILLLALLLFGGFKKLPEASRAIGKSLRIIKTETKGLRDDDDTPKADPSAQTAQVPQPLPQGQAAPAQQVPTPTPTQAETPRDQH